MEEKRHTGHQNCVRIPVIPSCSKGKTGLNEALNEIRNGRALQGEVDGNFTKVVHDVPHQCHHSQICQEGIISNQHVDILLRGRKPLTSKQQGQRTGHLQDGTGTNEEASTNAAPNVSEMAILLIEADEQVHSRSTKGQELDMPTLEASLKLILSTNQVAGAIIEDPDLANLLVLALLRVRPLGGQIRRAIALHDRGCGCGCVWLEPRDNACMWSRVLSEKKIDCNGRQPALPFYSAALARLLGVGENCAKSQLGSTRRAPDVSEYLSPV